MNSEIANIVNLMRDGKYLARVKLSLDTDATNWSRWLTSPAEGYLEMEGYGPFRINVYAWIEIRYIATCE